MQRKTVTALLAIFVCVLFPAISLPDHLTIPQDELERLMNEAQRYLQEYKLPDNDIDFPMKVEEKLRNISMGVNKQLVKLIMYVKPSLETDDKLVFDFGKKWDSNDKKNFRAVILFKEGKVIEKYILYDGYVDDFSEIRKSATRQKKE